MLLITVKHVVISVIIGSPTLTYHLNELLYIQLVLSRIIK